MPDDTGIDPNHAAGAGPHAIARRVALEEYRKRQAAAGAGPKRGRTERPAGLLLTSVVVIVVLFGTLAIMILTQ